MAINTGVKKPTGVSIRVQLPRLKSFGVREDKIDKTAGVQPGNLIEGKVEFG